MAQQVDSLGNRLCHQLQAADAADVVAVLCSLIESICGRCLANGLLMVDGQVGDEDRLWSAF
jgi:hypothetical protein